MCGIFAVFGHHGDMEQFRSKAIALSKRIRHRGPDWTGIRVAKNNVMCHERLAIVGVDSGAQPLTNTDETIILCVNGEIYNHKRLRQQVTEKRIKEGKEPPVFRTGSDCEVILALYEDFGVEFLGHLDGMFSLVLYDVVQDRYIAARDPIGIIPLYQGHSQDGSVWFASELKSIFEDCSQSLISFEPGTFYDSRSGISQRWFKPTYWDEKWLPNRGIQLKNIELNVQTMADWNGKIEFDKDILENLRNSLEAAVEKMLMSEVPYGVLLSGGLDSSLIASIASRSTAKLVARSLDQDPQMESLSPSKEGFWSPRLHSFSIGLPGSPDLLAARKVADFLGTRHHEFTFTVQEGIDAIRDVVHHLETYDVTTIRASTPMFLMSRKIKATGVKMVLSGEGSDEVFGGYLYFHQAPLPEDLHKETVARVKLLHTSDCLRANKSTMAWGLEARVPFLDTPFLEMAMSLPPEFKHPKLTPRKIEKELLRLAFDVSVDDGHGRVRPYLPQEILWRQKEQFSDGVGYSWIDELKLHAESSVEDSAWNDRAVLFPHDTPTSREAFFFRKLFEDEYCPATLCPDNESKLTILKTVQRWIPRRDWGCAEDPSGRAQIAHEKAYDGKNT